MANQKVWMIGEEDWNRTSAPADKETVGTLQETVVLKSGESKSPALAFSLSMLFWGSGQIYLGRHRRGTLFLAGMLLFAILVALLSYFGAPLVRLFVQSGHQPLLLSLGIHLLFLSGPILGLVSAVDAYTLAQETESGPFNGVELVLWPVLGSLVFPGWGQFLNGQRRKGGLFLLCGFAGLFSAIIIWRCWALFDLLSSDTARLVLEWYLIAALLVAPLALLGWVASIYDAYRACHDLSLKKGSLENVGFKVWSKDILQSLVPRATTVLSLLLAISVGIQLFPREYYLGCLNETRSVMANHHLQILPELARRVALLLGR